MRIEKLWKPSNFPWTAVRKCVDVGQRFNGEPARVVWYTILDELGNEIMNTERAREDEDCQVRAEVAFILMTVNKSRTIIIDKKPVTIDWIGDANGNDIARQEQPGNPGGQNRGGGIQGFPGQFGGVGGQITTANDCSSVGPGGR